MNRNALAAFVFCFLLSALSPNAAVKLPKIFF
jgi:hypothetical protein